MSKFKNVDDMIFQVGTTTTGGDGSSVITLDCFRPDEIPCIVASSYDIDGNSNVNATDIQLVGNAWQATIITSAPNIKVHYHAFKVTKLPTNIITQDLFSLVTQNNETIVIQ